MRGDVLVIGNFGVGEPNMINDVIIKEKAETG